MASPRIRRQRLAKFAAAKKATVQQVQEAAPVPAVKEEKVAEKVVAKPKAARKSNKK